MKQCGAKTRTNEQRPCRQAAMANGRCRFHGGMSTGPRTEKGKKRARAAVLKHGFYTRKSAEERVFLRTLLQEGWGQLQHLIEPRIDKNLSID